MRFDLEPPPGEENFSQWCDAIRVANRMSGGVPNLIRRKVTRVLFIHSVFFNSKCKIKLS